MHCTLTGRRLTIFSMKSWLRLSFTTDMPMRLRTSSRLSDRVSTEGIYSFPEFLTEEELSVITRTGLDFRVVEINQVGTPSCPSVLGQQRGV